MAGSAAASLIAFVLAVEGKPISTRFDVGVRMPPQQLFASSRSHQGGPFSTRQQSQERPPLNPRFTSNSIRTLAQAETEAAPAAPAKADVYANIFEEPLETCVDDDYCTYRSAKMATHDICTGIRLAERVKDVGMAFKAGPVNEDCYSILTYGTGASQKEAESQGFYFIPKCNALPAGVLDSQFSVDMMTGTPLKEGADKGEKTSLSSLALTRATKQFRRAIESICDLCSAEAPNEKAKANLEAACTKLKAVQLAEQPEYDTSVISVFLVGVVSTFLGAGATFAMFRFRRSAWTGAEESLLSA
jgi:hypothetical protein